MPVVVGYALALLAGVSFVFQQAVNSNLREEMGSPWWAGFISYAGGTLAMLVMLALVREPLTRSSASSGSLGRRHLRSNLHRHFNSAAAKTRAATVIALLVARQMLGSWLSIISDCSAFRCINSRPSVSSVPAFWSRAWH